jgi:hypothetical protein
VIAAAGELLALMVFIFNSSIFKLLSFYFFMCLIKNTGRACFGATI